MTPFPIESLHGAHRALGLALAILFGAAFGFVLERGGLGRPQKLVGQFYGYDMTVLRVLFTAIVTAMVGVVVLSGLGILDLGAVQARYPTFLWPMIVGGFVLGAGFVVAGYCPGTCVVGAASGKLDALATIGGLIVGGLAHAYLEPALGSLQNAGALGTFTLPQWLGLPPAVVAFAAVLVAVGAFAAAGHVERLVAARRSIKKLYPATGSIRVVTPGGPG